ncbi:MAG: hypothetical protein KAT65_03835 [Methanophagales archaeon]|nr:hypothetical protein [Methanophagales archaeon]
MATDWHDGIVAAKREELRQKGFNTFDTGKMIGFKWPAGRESQIKGVDILAENENEIVIAEVEDLTKRGAQIGVSFTELGGIILSSYIASKHTKKKVELCLIFSKNIEKPRLAKLKEYIDDARSAVESLNGII